MLKMIRLFVGIFLCSSSTVFMLNSNLGLLPWDVFHQGVSKVIGLDIGITTIIVSFIVLIISFILEEKIGFGTLVSIVGGGILVDIINNSNMIPKATNIYSGLFMILIGMIVMGIGCYFYISCGLGCGPRDSTMIGFSKKLNKSVQLIKVVMEVTALIVGVILGGKFGLGTIIPALFLGVFIELPFKIAKCDVKQIKHKSLKESYLHIIYSLKLNRDKNIIFNPSHN